MAHRCKVRGEYGMYGAAITRCREDEDGRFWVDNKEYESQVNYCPQCGAKAPVQVDKDVHVYG